MYSNLKRSTSIEDKRMQAQGQGKLRPIKFRLLIVSIITLFALGCSIQPSQRSIALTDSSINNSELDQGAELKKGSELIPITSPMGIFLSNTPQNYWLAILQSGHYLVCNSQQCEKKIFETVAVDYGVILIDFFQTEVGKQIEREIYGGQSVNHEYLKQMKSIRSSSNRPDDLVLNIAHCNRLPCVRLGRRGGGITFYQVDSFPFLR